MSRNKKVKEEKPVDTAEAKIHCDEAAGHLKNGNYTKALTSYNLVIKNEQFHRFSNSDISIDLFSYYGNFVQNLFPQIKQKARH